MWGCLRGGLRGGGFGDCRLFASCFVGLEAVGLRSIVACDQLLLCSRLTRAPPPFTLQASVSAVAAGAAAAVAAASAAAA